MHDSICKKNGVHIETQLDELLPAVRAEKVQLEQVLLNLITNAIDAMRTVEARQLRVTTGRSKQDMIIVSVEDSGTGIDPTTVESIFKALFTTKSRGMGMGLSICQSIIENHGGRIWAAPGTIRGSVFQFELPIML